MKTNLTVLALFTASAALFAGPNEIPSGKIPSACIKVSPSALLNCYLNDPSSQKFTNHMVWNFGSGVWNSWSTWPAWAKNDLTIAYLDTVAWYKGGMKTYAGNLPKNPPPNTDAAAWAAGTRYVTALDETSSAWPIYVGNLALTLAVEINGWVPWSLHNFDYPSLYELLNDGYNGVPYGLPGFAPRYDATPGNAIDNFKFLKTNNLIGSTRLNTIERVLTWSRKNMSHRYGNSAVGYDQYWQYWGRTPVIRIIDGTYTSDPAASQYFGPKMHWTANCHTTTAFLHWVLRAVNIPVRVAPAGLHSTPHFMSENLYLSHGDDPYNSGFSTSSFLPKDLLINQTTYQSWFLGNDTMVATNNAGRRIAELNLIKPSADLINTYKLDLDWGRTHETGNVFACFKTWYTLAELEAAGLWTKLDLALPAAQ